MRLNHSGSWEKDSNGMMRTKFAKCRRESSALERDPLKETRLKKKQAARQVS